MRILLLVIALIQICTVQEQKKEPELTILYVDRYRQEFYYLEKALIRDKTCKVHCFQTDADKNFPQECSPGLKPLESLPTAYDDIKNYDVVIIGDTEVGEDQRMKEFIELVAKFGTEKGGGIIFLSGYNSPECFVKADLEPFLPVVPHKADDKTEVPAYDKEYEVVPTGEGEKSEVFKTPEDAEKVDWNQALSIYWYKPVKDVGKGSTILAQTKTKIPILIAKLHGSARVACVLTDEVWHMRKLRGDNPYYYKFWKNLINWVSNKH